ncbi:MAG: hypothetical protein NUV98_04445 [Candidatus Roizmanbacteria bacterium]|nr:hypothetical protein [Candidatus Roizmanbacteria bacterium]
MRGIGRVVKNFIWPPISELDIVTFFFITFLVLLEFRVLVYQFMMDYWDEGTFNDIRDILLMGIFISVFLWVLVRHAFVHEIMKESDRSLLALFFYLSITMASFMSFTKSIEVSDMSFIQHINRWISIFLLTRSIISFVFTAVLARAKQDHVFASQVNDEQVTKPELIIIIILATSLYFFLRLENPVATSTILTYFYSTTILLLLRNFLRAPLLTHPNKV